MLDEYHAQKNASIWRLHPVLIFGLIKGESRVYGIKHLLRLNRYYFKTSMMIKAEMNMAITYKPISIATRPVSKEFFTFITQANPLSFRQAC